MLSAFAYLCTTNRHYGEQTSSESSSVGRARPCQGRGREFEPRLPLQVSNAAFGWRFLFSAVAAPRKCLSTDEQFRLAVAESLSVQQVLARIGLVPAGGNYKTVHNRIKLLGLDTGHSTGAGWNVGERYKAFGHKATLEEILVENSAYAFTHGLRCRLLKEGLKRQQCECCGLAEWCGQPIPLELHHDNGVNNDHRLSNLHLLCPNCHALTANYRGKNQGNKKV